MDSSPTYYKRRNFFFPFLFSLLSEMPRCFFVVVCCFSRGIISRTLSESSMNKNFLETIFWFYRFSPSCGLLTARVSVGFFFVKEKGKKSHTNVSKLKSRTEEKRKEEKEKKKQVYNIPHVEANGGMNGESFIIHITPNYNIGVRSFVGWDRRSLRLCVIRAVVSRRVK